MTIVISILALGAIIMIHEFGHFLFAKLFGVGVVEFSIGFGPRILSRVFHNTCFSLRALPFGGACMMLGEQPAETEEASQQLSQMTNAETGRMSVEVSGDEIIIDGRHYPVSSQFIRKPAWQRFLVILAGPLFNFILAFLLSLIVVGCSGYDRPTICESTPGMPAYEAGIREGDEVTAIACGGQSEKIRTAGELMLFLTENADRVAAGEPVEITWKDASGAVRQESLVPRYDETEGRKRMGFSYCYDYTKCRNLPELIRYSIHNVVYSIRSTVASLRMIFGGKISRNDVMGPVRMVTTMGSSMEQAESYGSLAALMTLLDLMILISGSLGSMNLLPVPALDGGRLLFILIEMIIRRPLPKKFEGIVNAAGMLLLFALMILILFNDISILAFH